MPKHLGRVLKPIAVLSQSSANVSIEENLSHFRNSQLLSYPGFMGTDILPTLIDSPTTSGVLADIASNLYPTIPIPYLADNL